MDMVTIGGYYPSAGKNTIRKAWTEYNDVLPGTVVRMEYYATLSTSGQPVGLIATETLLVTSVVKATFDRILGDHTQNNNAYLPEPHRDPSMAGQNRLVEASQLREHLADLYDVTDEDTLFMAIYFA